jgi:hypothetical protein
MANPSTPTKAPAGLAPTFEPPRAPMRESAESSQERAAQRVAELRGHFAGGVLDDSIDEFYVDLSTIPAGWTYEWKTHTVLGKEDPAAQVALARTGWTPVPASRHPEMMPKGYADSVILRKGLMLMERPEEITNEAKENDYRRARNQVRVKEQQLSSAPQGQFERDNSGAPLANIKKSYTPVVVPE